MLSGIDALRTKDDIPDESSTEKAVPFTSRFAFALIAGCIYGGVLVWLLFRPVSTQVTRPLEGWSGDRPAFLAAHTRAQSAPFARKPLPNGDWLHSIDLVDTGSFPETNIGSISFKLDVVDAGAPSGNQAAEATILSGSLISPGGSRHFQSSLPERIRTEESYMLRAQRPEAADGAAAPSNHWTLSFITKEPVELRLRCHATPENESQSLSTNVGCFAVALRHSAGEPAGRFAYPHGYYTLAEPAAPITRAGMISWTWNWNSDGVWRWVAASAGLLAIGVFLLPFGKPAHAFGWVARTGLGTGLIFGAFGLAQLVTTPAFLGTDEAAHFFSYATWMNDPVAETSGKAEGLRLHISRLFCRPEQKLTSYDRAQPWWWFIDNPSTMDTRPLARSAIAAHIWARTRGWIADAPALMGLFQLRLLSLCVASLGVAWAAAILGWATPLDERSPWIGWTPLLIPSLPYLAMNLSNYPVLYGEMAVLTASVAALLLTPRRPWWLGLMLGASVGLVLHTSQSAFPAAAFVVMTLVAMAIARIFRPEMAEQPGRVSLAFWLWLGGGLLAIRALTTPWFDDETRSRLAVGGAFATGPTLLGYTGLAALAIIGVAIIEAIAAQFHGSRSEAWGRRAGRLGLIAAFLIIAGIGFNSAHATPRLAPLEEIVPTWDFIPNQGRPLPSTEKPFTPSPNPAPMSYARATLTAMAGSFGAGGHDFMTSRLFWGLSGYLDTLTPDFWTSFLTVFFAAGLALLFLEFALVPDGERALLLVGMLAGLALCVALMAAASVASVAKPSLHGRYLVGVYLGLLTISLLGWRKAAAAGSTRWPLACAAVAILVPIAHQLSVLWAELGRYYGS